MTQRRQDKRLQSLELQVDLLVTQVQAQKVRINSLEEDIQNLKAAGPQRKMVVPSLASERATLPEVNKLTLKAFRVSN